MHCLFIPGQIGQRFCLYHAAKIRPARGAIIYLHPFAEEMNKSRRMAALQTRALADAGFDVLQIDLFGCGDSAGDFSDATWQSWQADVSFGYQWLRTQSQAPLILWGLRAGCILAANAAVDLPENPNFIFWQPVVSGKQHWQQFMRLKIAGEIASGKTKGIAEQIKQQVAAGQAVEIAGYMVSPGLANGLESAQMQPPTGYSGCVAWFELSAREGATIPPAAQKSIEQWQDAGFTVNTHVVHGPAFWQTAEIEDAPELLVATLAAVESWQ